VPATASEVCKTAKNPRSTPSTFHLPPSTLVSCHRDIRRGVQHVRPLPPNTYQGEVAPRHEDITQIRCTKLCLISTLYVKEYRNLMSDGCRGLRSAGWVWFETRAGIIDPTSDCCSAPSRTKQKSLGVRRCTSISFV
jgi:hypothetical protein